MKIITPTEAAQDNDAKEVKILHELVNFFNVELASSYITGGSAIIAIPDSMTERLERKLRALWKDAGWAIERKHDPGFSDQRDPRDYKPPCDYFVFKNKKEKSA